MNYAPVIGAATPVKRISLPSGKHTAILLDNIESKGSIEYRIILAVFNDQTREPCLFVASEVNAMAKELGGGSHFLGLFPGDGHMNYGDSDDWADMGKFEKAAVELAIQHLMAGEVGPS
jgi:hypothetical protein